MNRILPWTLPVVLLIACNRPPGSPAVTLSPAQPTTADELVATWTGDPDPNGDAIEWEVRWLVDGEEHSREISSGESRLPADETTRGQTWTVEVTASDGHLRSDPVTASVLIVNAAPEGTASISPAAPTTLDTLVASALTSDLDRDEVTQTWTWRRDGDPTPFENQDVPPEATERGQVWTLKLEISDGSADTSLVETSTTIVNAPPVLSDLILQPDDLTMASPPTASVTAFDPDDDVLTLRWSWRLGGVEVATTPYLDPALVSWSRGDMLEVTVTADDGMGGVATLSSGDLSVQNNPPLLADAPVILPARPTVADVLSCTAPTSDPDGDPVSLTWGWTHNGQPWSAESTIPAHDFRRGDTVGCTLTPRDAFLSGPARTTEVVLQNALPVVRVRVDPPTPGTDDLLVATPTQRYDADGDEVGLTYTWYVNGVHTADGPVLRPEQSNRGDVVEVSVVPHDGLESGETARSGPVEIGNTAPVVRSVQLLPDPPTATAELSAAVDTFDADGDEIELRWAWWVDDVLISTDPVLPAGSVQRGQSVVVEVTPADRSGDGELAASAPVIVANSPPTAAGVVIRPEVLHEEQTAGCIPQGTYDPDGDVVGGTITWLVDGVPVGGGSTLDGDHFDKGQQVSCVYEPRDDLGPGAQQTAGSVAVVNTPPRLSAVALTPVEPRRGKPIAPELQGLYDPDPADQGRIVVQTRWEVDGMEVARAPTLSDDLFVRGQTVVAAITPSDPDEAGDTVLSPAVVVRNAPPVVQRINLGPNPTYTDTPASASAEAFDADGDELQFSFTWNVDGYIVDTNDGTLDPDWYEKGQAVVVQAVAWDGIDASVGVWSGLLLIQNTPPRAPSVVINPPWPVAGQDELVCHIASPSVDPDFDVVTYDVDWTVDGQPYPRPGDRGPLSTAWPGDTVNAFDIEPGQRWACVATPYDITHTGVPASAERVPLLPYLRSVSAGDGHACAVELDGSVRCWGRNVAGAAVPPVVTASRVFAAFDETCTLDTRGFIRCWGAVPAISQVPLGLYVDLSLMFGHACAIRTDYTVECWGSDTWGESSPPNRPTFRQVSAGVDHACGREADGSISCWGRNDHGQTDVPDAGPWVDVVAGASVTCGINREGELHCWGADAFVNAAPTGSFRELSAGVTHMCAITTDDAAVCWGPPEYGDLTPPPGPWISVSPGTLFACGLSTAGEMDCWGDTAFGQGVSPARLFQRVEPGVDAVCAIDLLGQLDCWGIPGVPLLAAPAGLADLVDLAVGADHACVRDADGLVTCWGGDDEGEASPTITHAQLLAAGSGLTCAIAMDGTLACWGDNDEGQAEPPAGDAWIDVAVASNHACALDSLGQITCWGSAEDGRLDVPQDMRFVDVDVGWSSSCGVGIDGTVACWGEVIPGGPRTTDSSFARISVDDVHACATRVNGEVLCWGDSSGSRLAAPDVSLLDVRTSYNTSCGISWDGEARCWGAWMR